MRQRRFTYSSRMRVYSHNRSLFARAGVAHGASGDGSAISREVVAVFGQRGASLGSVQRTENSFSQGNQR